MSHRNASSLHAYRNRAEDINLTIITDLEAADITEPLFRITDQISKPISLTDGNGEVEGVLVLTAADLDLIPATYKYEVLGTVSDQQRTIGVGYLTVESEPTT